MGLHNGYIIFEQTLSELYECQERLPRIKTKDLSKSEARCAKELVQVCKEIAEEWSDIFEEIDTNTYEQDFGSDDEDEEEDE